MAKTKSRSERMAALESLTGNEAKQLAVQMGQQSTVLKDSEAKLLELQNYLHSYLVPSENSRPESVSAMQLLEKHTFVERLKEAVSAQEQVVQGARSRYELARAQWLAKHLRVSALGKAVQRLRLDEDEEQNRREQGAQDEIAARTRQTR